MSDEAREIMAGAQRAHDLRHGVEPEPAAPNREDAKAAEARAIDNAMRRPERQREAEKFGKVRRTLLTAVDRLRHGEHYTDHDREAIAAEVMGRLGPDADKAKVRALVNAAADAIETGDKGTGLEAVDDTAAAIVNGLPGHWQPGAPNAEADNLDDLNPGQLVDRLDLPRL